MTIIKKTSTSRTYFFITSTTKSNFIFLLCSLHLLFNINSFFVINSLCELFISSCTIIQSGHNHLLHFRQYLPSFECELHFEKNIFNIFPFI